MDLIDPCVVPDWDKLVAVFPEANIFHSASWARTLRDSYGYRPLYAAWSARDEIVSIVPLMEITSFITGRRGVSLPFSDFCPILNKGNVSSSEIIRALLETGRLRKWKTIELRDPEINPSGSPAENGFLVHELDLSQGEEALFRGIRDSTRRNIRKAERLGVSIVEENDEAGLKKFCRLNLVTRREHGLPPQPPRFFSSLLRNIIAKGNGRVLIARFENSPVAAGVFLSFNGKTIYKYGASERGYRHLRANNLLIWEAIRTYAAKGMNSFHFGKTNRGQEGLLQFKRGWGAEEHSFLYREFRLPDGRPVPSKDLVFGIHNRVFSRMPLSALSLIGRVLYRHVG